MPLNPVFDGPLRDDQVSVTRAQAIAIGGLLMLTPVTARALDVSVQVIGCQPGFCGWWLTLASDRSASVEFLPERHLSRRFTLSSKRFAEVKALLLREDFFSLPTRLGNMFPDSTTVEIEVRDGTQRRKVLLGYLPSEFVPIWKTDPSSVGRAFRVCEALSALIPRDKAEHCPVVIHEPSPQK